MNEMSMAEKEAVLRDNPELRLDDLDGALNVEVLRKIRDDGQPDGFVICELAGEEPGMGAIRVMRFRSPEQAAEVTIN